MLSRIVSFASSPKVVATTLVVVGGSVFMNFDILSKSFFTLPIVGDVSIIRVLGACGVIAGAAMFMGRGDMVGSKQFVAAAESMIEGGYAHGHL
jgi:hypothetical protein